MLPGFVGAAALGLGTDLEDRQDLETRALDATVAEEMQKALPALGAAVRPVDLGDRHHRGQPGALGLDRAFEDPFEGPVTTDRIVRLGVVAIERNPQVERVVAGPGHLREALAAFGR